MIIRVKIFINRNTLPIIFPDNVNPPSDMRITSNENEITLECSNINRCKSTVNEILEQLELIEKIEGI
ncbi:hypothetical protein HS7_06380 [Sulfolobales archaeon HS-7]|nr:hypothetical protein HS7_06380 [Sulfolobales archaeon HS-7]